MKCELPYFKIGDSYGGQQKWFNEYMMKIGGCAAVTACDSSIYFEKYKGKSGLYPGDKKNITREDYVNFSEVMKPYLHPRWLGIDKLSIYIEGFEKFLSDRGEKNLKISPWFGENDVNSTHYVLKKQIDDGWLIPCLVLNHVNPIFEEYSWHWFLLTGYEKTDAGEFFVKVVSYGIYRWFSFDLLWDSGFERKGGMILFSES